MARRPASCVCDEYAASGPLTINESDLQQQPRGSSSGTQAAAANAYKEWPDNGENCPIFCSGAADRDGVG
jgi:hypothetical protein